MSDIATTESEAGPAEVLIVTDAARATVLDIRAQEDDGDTLGLRVEVTGASGVDYTYDLSLEPVAEAADDDHVHEHEGLTVIVPAKPLRSAASRAAASRAVHCVTTHQKGTGLGCARPLHQNRRGGVKPSGCGLPGLCGATKASNDLS